jgi:hypothetical protein
MLYGRFLDVHIGHSGQYDFESDIVAQMEREGSKLSHSRTRMNWSPWAGGSGRDLSQPIQDSDLPTRGVIVIGVELDDIDNRQVMSGMTALVKWVNNKNHSGKIRFNVHGTATGGLTMGRRAGHWAETDAVNAAEWLIANGLEPVSGLSVSSAVGIGRGLTTVAFAICMGGRDGVDDAKLSLMRISTKPAGGSTVRKFGNCLSMNKIKGVKITGSNEIVAGGGGSDAGTWGRSVALAEFYNGGERKISGPQGSWIGRGILTVPPPFVITRESGSLARGTISYPSDCTATFYGGSYDGWEIVQGGVVIAKIPDTGWIVDTATRKIKGPVGWFMTPNPKGQPGGKIKFTLKNTSVDMATGQYWQRLSYTPFKVTMTS